MASLYRRARSPFWWASYIDPATGVRRQRSTHLRLDSIPESRKARDLCREMAQAEQYKYEFPEAWECWVPRLLEQRYSDRPQSLQRYRAAWRNLSVFLEEHMFETPRQLSRSAVRDYIAWRAVRHGAVYIGSRNTALLELVLLGLVMREAVQSGFASVNPCERLGIGREVSPRKPRISEIEHQSIMEALEQRPEWMRISYAVAWEQGCRFSETHMHIPTQIDIKHHIIRFRTKGHKETLAEFPLAPKLVPMFARMIAEGREWTFAMPRSPGKQWWSFFRQIGLPALCFHCTRVTFITRCYEAGIPKEMVKRLVGHASDAAHSVYPRLTADDSRLRALRAALE